MLPFGKNSKIVIDANVNSEKKLSFFYVPGEKFKENMGFQ